MEAHPSQESVDIDVLKIWFISEGQNKQVHVQHRALMKGFFITFGLSSGYYEEVMVRP